MEAAAPAFRWVIISAIDRKLCYFAKFLFFSHDLRQVLAMLRPTIIPQDPQPLFQHQFTLPYQLLLARLPPLPSLSVFEMQSPFVVFFSSSLFGWFLYIGVACLLVFGGVWRLCIFFFEFFLMCLFVFGYVFVLFLFLTTLLAILASGDVPRVTVVNSHSIFLLYLTLLVFLCFALFVSFTSCTFC